MLIWRNIRYRQLNANKIKYRIVCYEKKSTCISGFFSVPKYFLAKSKLWDSNFNFVFN